jgi:hypothetical protein
MPTLKELHDEEQLEAEIARRRALIDKQDKLWENGKYEHDLRILIRFVIGLSFIVGLIPLWRFLITVL